MSEEAAVNAEIIKPISTEDRIKQLKLINSGLVLFRNPKFPRSIKTYIIKPELPEDIQSYKGIKVTQYPK